MAVCHSLAAMLFHINLSSLIQPSPRNCLWGFYCFQIVSPLRFGRFRGWGSVWGAGEVAVI